MNENYRLLREVLDAAYLQASEGKGAERHGDDLPFEEQRMLGISRLLDSPDGMAYQVAKKVLEARGLPTFERQERELLGAINYIAGMIIFLREKKALAEFNDKFKGSAPMGGCPHMVMINLDPKDLVDTAAAQFASLAIDLTHCDPLEILALKAKVAEQKKEAPLRAKIINWFVGPDEELLQVPGYLAAYESIIAQDLPFSQSRGLIAELNRSTRERIATE